MKGRPMLKLVKLVGLLSVALIALPVAARAGTDGTPPNCSNGAILVEAQSWIFNGSGRVQTATCFNFQRPSYPAGHIFTVRTTLHSSGLLHLVRYSQDATVLESHTKDIVG